MNVDSLKQKKRQLQNSPLKQVEVENLGLRALEISDRLRLEALDAQEKLAGYGVTIIQVVDGLHPSAWIAKDNRSRSGGHLPEIADPSMDAAKSTSIRFAACSSGSVFPTARIESTT